MSTTIPQYSDVTAAASRIADHAVHTPLLRSIWLDELTGCRVYIKPENLQRTGSFKFRGAYNALASLTVKEREKGILAVSSGNHAQGIAEAARIFGVQATIIMPQDAPAAKIERTKRSGAEIVLYDRLREDREALPEALLEKTGAVFIHPFENPKVIAGQGTSGLEALEDMKADGASPDHILVCTGGGGLTAGIALVAREKCPKAKLHTCEPAGFDDYRRSLVSGKREQNAAQGGSICDAILTPSPGQTSFSIMKSIASQGFVVSDDEAMHGVALCFRELKLAVEPGGAVALAALLKNKALMAGKTVLVLISGGNIDPQVLQQSLSLSP